MGCIDQQIPRRRVSFPLKPRARRCQARREGVQSIFICNHRPSTSGDIIVRKSCGFRGSQDTRPAPFANIEEHAKEGPTGGNLIPIPALKCLIHPYVSSSDAVNSLLRKGESRRLSEQERNFVTSLEAFLVALPPYPFPYVYRGLEAKTQEDVLAFKTLLQKGEPFVERGFLSTSALSFEQQKERRDVSNVYHQMNTYIAIKSKTGRLIQRYSRRKDEWEVLFATGTSFRVLSFEDTTPSVDHQSSDKGRYRIVMEELPKI